MCLILSPTMKIAIIGVGYVGLVSGACFAKIGHEVICIDIDQQKIENLKKGIIPIYEPGLKELVIRNQKEGRLHFSLDIKKGIEFAEIVFSAVGTPADKNHKADLKYVKEIAKSFGKYLNSYKIFVNKSTVPAGTGEICERIILSELDSRNSKLKFDVASNPEFLREGSAIKDTMEPDRIIVGTNSKKAQEIMKKIYDPIVNESIPLLFTDIKSAELIKYASNAFLATKISFINEIANFCEINGANIKDVASGIGMDKRIGMQFLNPGIGYGGSCLPKDLNSLIGTGKKNHFKFNILEAVKKVNENQKEILIKKLQSQLKKLEGKTISILGLSFKPNTDDLREAPSISIIKKLAKFKVNIRVYDPIVKEKILKIFIGEKEMQKLKLVYSKNTIDCIKNTDACLIITEWDEFKNLGIEDFEKNMKGNLVFDGRNIYKSEDFEKTGIKYISIGRF